MIATTSIFLMVIIASKACLASSPPTAGASVSTRGVIWQETLHLSLTPAACALLAAIADDGVPVTVGLFLIAGSDLKREGFVVLDGGAAIEGQAGNSGDGELNHQHIAFPARRVLARSAVDRGDRAAGKVPA
ncbi:MAG TPA: hypothetical protein VHY79_03140 [Rhizomicrobium sp.]|nr:hypothetical protein [Rhizomicrobium sp.]